jgi:hypothetical protein
MKIQRVKTKKIEGDFPCEACTPFSSTTLVNF